MTVSEEINKLPKHLRDYIHELESASPADLAQEVMNLRENQKALLKQHGQRSRQGLAMPEMPVLERQLEQSGERACVDWGQCAGPEHYARIGMKLKLEAGLKRK